MNVPIPDNATCLIPDSFNIQHLQKFAIVYNNLLTECGIDYDLIVLRNSFYQVVIKSMNDATKKLEEINQDTNLNYIHKHLYQAHMILVRILTKDFREGFTRTDMETLNNIYDNILIRKRSCAQPIAEYITD